MMDMDKQENQCNILSCRSGTVGTWGCSPCIKFPISIPSYDNCVTVGVLRYEGILVFSFSRYCIGLGTVVFPMGYG